MGLEPPEAWRGACRLVVAITGATGTIYGIRLIEAACTLGLESHLIISEWGRRTMRIETDRRPGEVSALASRTYDEHDVSAPPADPAFPADGMAIVPCSMRTLAAVANRQGDNLIHRA